MTHQLYIIRDTLAQAPAGPLVVLPHDAVAIRMFQEVVNEKSNQIARFLQDHELLCVGELDTETCTLTALPEPRVVLTGKTLQAVSTLEVEA